MKKILLLGGSKQQISAILMAKNLGYYTVLVDYLIDNPGQEYADKFYCESTTNIEKVLEISINENIDGILSYASDPAAPTAAYVAEKMSLPTNPYNSIEILANKGKFRNFLKQKGFNYPKALVANNYNEISKNIKNLNFPLIVKPTDSSGSKGVTKVNDLKDLNASFDYAMTFSRNKSIIIEEFIKKDHDFLVGGDIFVLNGEVVFWGLLNCHRSNVVTPLIPIGKSFPLLIEKYKVDLIKSFINKLVRELKIEFGAFNVEVIVDKNNEVYLIELGPRNGGNYIPNFLNLIFGIDTIKLSIMCCMGEKVDVSVPKKNDKFYFSFNIHSHYDGILKNIFIDERVIKNIVYRFPSIKSGEKVYTFNGSNKVIEIIFMEFNDYDIWFDIINNPEKYIKVFLD
jgi:biotin carboxylase